MIRPGPTRPECFWGAHYSKTMRYMEKYYPIRIVYSRLKSYVLKFQLCIYDTSWDTAVFMKVFFWYETMKQYIEIHKALQIVQLYIYMCYTNFRFFLAHTEAWKSSLIKQINAIPARKMSAFCRRYHVSRFMHKHFQFINDKINKIFEYRMLIRYVDVVQSQGNIDPRKILSTCLLKEVR